MVLFNSVCCCYRTMIAHSYHIYCGGQPFRSLDASSIQMLHLKCGMIIKVTFSTNSPVERTDVIRTNLASSSDRIFLPSHPLSPFPLASRFLPFFFGLFLVPLSPINNDFRDIIVVAYLREQTWMILQAAFSTFCNR